MSYYFTIRGIQNVFKVLQLYYQLERVVGEGDNYYIVQLLRLYVQWGPGNYEKCKMFRLIHIIMMSLDKFRFVAQVATLGNFFY